MVVDIALGILLALLILVVGGALLGLVFSGAFGVLQAVGDAGRGMAQRRAWAAWRRDNPEPAFDAKFSPGLVDLWCQELESCARGLDGSYDFEGDMPRPSERDYELASELRSLAKALKVHVAASQAEEHRGVFPGSRSGTWLRAAEWALGSEQRTAESLDDPRMHWHAVRRGEILESLVTWLKKQVNVDADRNKRGARGASQSA